MQRRMSGAMRRWFRDYGPQEGDTLGEFLAHYHRRWLEAAPYGITGVEAITHLISQLPPEWHEWGHSLVPQYIDTAWIGGVEYGDFRGFVATISHRYFAFDEPPPPPYDAPPLSNDPFPIAPPPPVDLVPYVPEPVVPDEPIVSEPIIPEPAVPEPGILEAWSPVTDYDPFHFLTLIPFPSADLPPWEPIPATEPLPLPPSEITPPIPPMVPRIENVPFDPYPRVAPLPEPGTLEFQRYMHHILYPPSRDAQEGPSRLI